MINRLLKQLRGNLGFSLGAVPILILTCHCERNETISLFKFEQIKRTLPHPASADSSL